MTWRRAGSPSGWLGTMRLLREATKSFAGGVNDSVAQDEYLENQAQVLVNARPSLLGNALEWGDMAQRLSPTINYTGTSRHGARSPTSRAA